MGISHLSYLFWIHVFAPFLPPFTVIVACIISTLPPALSSPCHSHTSQRAHMIDSWWQKFPIHYCTVYGKACQTSASVVQFLCACLSCLYGQINTNPLMLFFIESYSFTSLSTSANGFKAKKEFPSRRQQ